MYNCMKSLFISKFVLFKPNKYLLGQVKLNQSHKCYCYLAGHPLNLKLRNVSLDKYIMHLENEYQALQDPQTNMKIHQSRLQELKPIINILHNRSNIIKDLESLQDLLKDPDAEIQRLALEEKHSYETKMNNIEQQLLDAILSADECNNHSSIMLEVNTGVGGQEAMLFAKELFYMYCSFAQFKKWQVEVVGYITTEHGGIRHGTALIKGQNAFRYFKFEGGVHRVQRIPTTEKMGRVHTSTVSVVVLPEPTEIEIVLDNKDLRIETKRASGAGGQHVNTTDSAVRITHIPTGVSVECQTDRSQIQNKKVAMQKLRSILYDQQQKTQSDKMASSRKSQVKSNFRNEKIRTYNFSQDRITDHRLQSSSNNVHNLKGFLTGGGALEELINKLDEHYRIEKLLDAVSELENK